MRHAAAELEQFFAGIAITLVLLYRICGCLLGKAVFQLERGDRQTVDKQAQVQCALGLVEAVAELARYRESVLGVAFNGKGVAGRWRSVEEFNVIRPVLDSLAEYVNDAALAYFAL